MDSHSRTGADNAAHVQTEQNLVAQRDLAYRLATATSLEEALPICLDIALRFQMDCGGIYLIDPVSGDLHLAYTSGGSPAFIAATSYAAAQSKRVQMVMAGQSCYFDLDCTTDIDQVEADEGVRALAVLPFTYQGRVIGCFNIGSHRYAAAEVSPAMREALEAIAAQVGHVIVRLQAEAALRESEAQSRAILQTSLDGFLMVNIQQWRVTEVNSAYCAMSGYSYAEIMGLQITEANMHMIVQRDSASEHLREIIAIGIGRFETRHRRKDGSSFDVEVSIQHINSGGGQLICFVRDITQRRQRENEIRTLNSDLERRVEARTADLSRVNVDLTRAMHMKDAFLATMSHELRTPMHGILAFAETLSEQAIGPLNERQIRSVQHITASGQHLLSLINDILDISKAESGRMDLQVDLVSVAEICQASLLFVKELAAKKSIRLFCPMGDEMDEHVAVDIRRMKQILVNLLSNAIKFTPANGQVTLEVAIDVGAEVIRFAVQDTGIGIAPENLGQLFQPFQQLDSRLSRQHEGTGLGLALVHRLADLHGGSVSVESAVGAGSRFTIALPYRPHAAGGAMVKRQRPSATARPSAGARILLAQDNEANIQTLQDYLEAWGYPVVAARNGQETIARAIEARPDLIIMDIQKSVLDGLAATRHLRSMPGLAATPIITLTALALPGDRERYIEAGANTYLIKPVGMVALMDVIGRLLAP
ncbi:MAG: ATP-binding protein [Chloroflexales bacterium]